MKSLLDKFLDTLSDKERAQFWEEYKEHRVRMMIEQYKPIVEKHGRSCNCSGKYEECEVCYGT